MSSQTCFVIMPIGDQHYANTSITAADLMHRYDDLIKEAILKAWPTLEVARADDVALPGTITSDIITRLMHSDFVVADVTYPNPNVFYELGLRHACRAGTVIIRDRSGPKTPFDIAQLRHIEYENSPTGLKDLAEQLKTFFAHFSANPGRPDNHFLELAKLTNYRFPDYGGDHNASDPRMDAILAVMQSPDLLNMFIRKSQGEEVDNGEIIRAIAGNPGVAQLLMKAMVRSGESPFNMSPIVQKNRGPQKRKRRR